MVEGVRMGAVDDAHDRDAMRADWIEYGSPLRSTSQPTHHLLMGDPRVTAGV